jgi:hypothetical protein
MEFKTEARSVQPYACKHNQACRTVAALETGEQVMGFGCPECGLKVLAGTWEDARWLFWVRAEKITVRRLMERRTKGEELKPNEQRMIAYSPFGDGNSHNF